MENNTMEISNIEKYFIDLSKCSEEQQKHIVSLLPDRKKTVQYWFDKHNILLYFDDEDGLWWVNGDIAPADKTELLYPEFIKLFEGGEDNNGWIKIESETPTLEQCGTEFLVCVEKSTGQEYQLCEWWNPEDGETEPYFNIANYWCGQQMINRKVTHWMPLPEPPKF